MQSGRTAPGQPWMEKFPYGKVDETGPPMDYEPADYSKFKVTDADEQRPDGAISVATMPWRYINRPADPDDYTEWVFKGNTKAKVANYPSFPRSVPKTSHPTPNYEVREAAGMGLGMFATRDLEIGEFIFAERPLLMMPTASIDNGTSKMARSKGYTVEEYKQAVLAENEYFLQNYALARMSEERKNAYLSLSNSHKEDGSGPCMGVLRTNSMAIRTIADGPDEGPITQLNGYCVVGALAARINFSCMNNVNNIFDVASFSLQFYALRRIKAGEQFFFNPNKHGAFKTVDQRQKAYEPYGVVCRCSLCTNATPESERKYQDISRRYFFVCMWVAAYLLKPYVRKRKNSSRGIAQARQLDDLIKRSEDLIEDLDSIADYGNEVILAFLHKLYLRAGRREEALAKDFVRYAALNEILESGRSFKILSSPINCERLWRLAK